MKSWDEMTQEETQEELLKEVQRRGEKMVNYGILQVELEKENAELKKRIDGLKHIIETNQEGYNKDITALQFQLKGWQSGLIVHDDYLMLKARIEKALSSLHTALAMPDENAHYNELFVTKEILEGSKEAEK
jgi:hypothetical protein